MTAPDQTVLDVRGMTCRNCTRHVERAVSAVPGVTAVSADLASGAVRISHAPDIDRDALVAAIDDAGYSVRPG